MGTMFDGSGFRESYDDRRRGDRNRRNMEEVVYVAEIAAVASVVELLQILRHRFMGTVLCRIDDERMKGVDEQRHQQKP